MKIDGLQRLLDFLDMLRAKGIHFFIEQQDPNGIMVTFTLVGARAEAYFSVDEVLFSIFAGKEDVVGDVEAIHELIKQHWDD